MKVVQNTLTIFAVLFLMIGCDSAEGEEESATQYDLTETYNEVRAGARLIVSYDAVNNSFMGTVENTTNSTLTQVRVEIHLSNGTELGPTPAADLAASARRDITLQATTTPFATWSAHPEVGGGEGGGEHGSGGEGGGN